MAKICDFRGQETQLTSQSIMFINQLCISVKITLIHSFEIFDKNYFLFFSSSSNLRLSEDLMTNTIFSLY
jgi:hypothetical protein